MVASWKWSKGKVFGFNIAFFVRNIKAYLNAEDEALEWKVWDKKEDMSGTVWKYITLMV